jgi:hypothetical protein
MPAAAALADAATNPTTPLVSSPLLLFNGTTWDRVRVDIRYKFDSVDEISSVRELTL